MLPVKTLIGNFHTLKPSRQVILKPSTSNWIKSNNTSSLRKQRMINCIESFWQADENHIIYKKYTNWDGTMPRSETRLVRAQNRLFREKHFELLIRKWFHDFCQTGKFGCQAIINQIADVSSLVERNNMNKLPDTENYSSWKGKIKYALRGKWRRNL